MEFLIFGILLKLSNSKKVNIDFNIRSDIEVQDRPPLGRGVFATAPIVSEEEVAVFDGEIYYGCVNSDFPPEVLNHLITFGPDRARHSKGIAHLLNHSCNPNVGVRGLFSLVTMRPIEAGEELCWDYDMSEDHDWQMECDCGSEHCRRLIRGFRFLPEEVRERYRGFISDWLVEKYGLDQGKPG